ncbi:MAG: hypothetical protein KGR69_02160 [Verrucomicrobia bacterium]|nr:hypothetical protein [Verrucomicrobiota bacterium]
MKTERVANLLNDWLSNNRYQQTALARKSGLTQLSFLRNGLRGMTRGALEGLLPALREEDRPILLKQWILDVLPDSYRDRVSFGIDGGKAKSNESLTGFPSLEEAFSILRRHAPENRELSRVLVNLANLLRDSRTRK